MGLLIDWADNINANRGGILADSGGMEGSEFQSESINLVLSWLKTETLLKKTKKPHKNIVRA